MNNDFFSQETISFLKIGLAQLLAGITFIVSGILNFKKNREFGFLLAAIGLLFIVFIFLFGRVMFSKNNISAIFSIFMLGIPQLLVGVVLSLVGISRLSRPDSKKSGILFLVLAGVLILTFVWPLIFFVSSNM